MTRRAERRKPVPDDHHGTYAGYQWHNRLSESPCEECRSARNEYMRAYRSTSGGKAAMRRQSRIAAAAIRDLIAAHRDEYQQLLDHHRRTAS